MTGRSRVPDRAALGVRAHSAWAGYALLTGDARAPEIASRGRQVKACCILAASGRELPELRIVLASHSLIHAAEGEFYQDAVAGSRSHAGIPVFRVREREMEAELLSLPIPMADVSARLHSFSKEVGPPWTSDEKLSAVLLG